jgi:hypothetical protein
MHDKDDTIDKMEKALWEIAQWAEAYPVAIFPEPDWQRANALLMMGGMSTDPICASAIRHVVRGIGQIARNALERS